MRIRDLFKRPKSLAPPATDKQLAYLQTLGNNATDERFDYVLRSCGHNPKKGASDILSDLSEEEASQLIEAFLVKPASEAQIGFIQNLISLCDPYDHGGGFYDDVSDKSLEWALLIARPRGEYKNAASFTHLSKKDASPIIDRLQDPEY
jgi:hypothetical protein